MPTLAAGDDERRALQPRKRSELLAELGGLLHLALPLVLQNIAGYTLSVVAAAFIGHLNDPVSLSAAVLAGSFYNISGYSLVIGLSAGMETLCGQAFGAENYPMLGLVLQRALLICWVACVPISVVWSQAHRLLSALGQAPEIVEGASRYLRIATPALYLSCVSSCLYRYLVTQQEVRPSTLCTIITAALCPFYNWLLIYKYKMGLDGGAWAFVLSTGTYSLLLLVYTCVRDARRAARRHPQHTWPGFSWRALEGWASYLHYALPAAAMICMEWWIFECVIFMAGSLGEFADVAVAVMGLSFHITSWTYMIPMSLGTAANTRVANALGAGSPASARRSAVVALLTAVATQLAISATLFLGRHSIARVFTQEEQVIHHVGRIIPVLAWSVLGDGMVAVLGGVLRGSGHQAMGALLNLCGYWLVGCPLAMLLGFKLRWDVVGFWCGLATATTLQAVILSVAVSRFDWQQEAQRAARLMAQQAQREAATQNGGGHGTGDAGGRLKPNHEGSREERSRLLAHGHANGHGNGYGNGQANGHGNGQHVAYVLDAEAMGAALAIATTGAASAMSAAAGAIDHCAVVGVEGAERAVQRGAQQGSEGAAPGSGAAPGHGQGRG